MEWLKQASTGAQKSDAVFFVVLGISVVMLVFITALMIYFVFRYSRKRHPKAEQIHGNNTLEVVWTAIPLAVFLAIFYYGWTNYSYMTNAPRDSMVVKVTGRQWSWGFQYPNGRTTNALYAPLGKPIKLEVKSVDVIHGFFIPAFRLKIDALPGRATTTWFEATQLGSYDVQCTVICGVQHAVMLAKVVVVPEEEFKAWYFGPEGTPEPGKQYLLHGQNTPVNVKTPEGVELLRAKGCLACHSTDGKPMVGPTFKGMVGITHEVITNGSPRIVTVDAAHLRKSIQNPTADVVKGYPPAMPAIALSAKELDEVVGTIQKLK